MRTQSCWLIATSAAIVAAGDANLDAQAKSLVDKMTLDDILGEMSQIDLNTAGNKVEEFANLHVGSYFNFLGMGRKGNRVTANVPEWRAKLKEMQDIHMKINKRPMIFGIDSVHGATYVDGSVLFPQSINTAATFNPELAKGLGKYMARDTKAAGIPWMFGPTLDVTRHKHWPRVYETFGEDPTVVSHMGKVVIEAIQKEGVAACFKHFISYSDPTSGLDRDNSELSTYEILNYFMPPFKAAIEADVWSGMGTFIALNKIPLAANELMHKGLLRGDLGFKGLMVTDFREINLLATQHYYVSSTLEAVEVSMKTTSYDISMVPDNDSFIRNGKQLVAANRLSEARLRESAVRIMKLKLKLGLFDNPVPGADVMNQLGDEPSQAAAIAIAEESLVLLKNEGNVLPMKSSSSIFLTGSNSDSIGLLCGGWSLWWQGAYESAVFPLGASVRTAMEKTLGADKFTFYQGLDIDGKLTDNKGNAGDLEAAKAMAAKADYTVVVLGERPYAEYKGNDDKQPFPEGFLTYVKALKTTGTKIILVLVEGRPRLLNGIAELAHAVVFAGLPCEFGGQAIVDVLLGKVNPSGKMAMTYPKTETAINLATPYYKRTKTSCFKDGTSYECPAEWHFGDGLSYTTFNYSNATVSTSSLTYNPSGVNLVSFSVTVQNTGKVKGKETVLLFGTPPTRPNAETKILKKYTKITLDAGETKVVTFTLTQQDFGYYSNEIGKGLKMDAPSGSYSFFFKHDTECDKGNNHLCLTVKWDNPTKSSFLPNTTDTAPVVAALATPAPTTVDDNKLATTSSPQNTDKNSSASTTDSSSPSSSISVGVIIAIVCGALCGVGLVALFVRTRRRRRTTDAIQVMGRKDDEAMIIVGSERTLSYNRL